MSDAVTIAIIVSIGPTLMAGASFWKQLSDAKIAKAERAAAAAAIADIGTKVDGAQSALLAKLDAASSANVKLKTEVSRLDEAGAASTNDSPGPVSIDASGAVNVAGEDRRR